MKSIKYKYYSDTSQKLWNLCYLFFDQCHAISIKRKAYDYLLAKNFNIVFEKMIDELLGDNIDEHGLKTQRDNKRVDHMFIYHSLMLTEKDAPSDRTYYIGDSKYYNRRELEDLLIEDEHTKEKGIRVDETSKYKQFTYARNVIQWNMDLFFREPCSDHLRIRPDSLTEGYNVIPNFFISAYIPYKGVEDRKETFDFNSDKLKPLNNVELNRHFNNRLFDRDTLLLSYYDINFLFVVALYGRNNQYQQSGWRNEVREKFRENVQTKLDKYYTFYKLIPKYDDWVDYIKKYFYYLNGKIFRHSSKSEYLVLELEKTADGNDRINEVVNNYFDSIPFTLSHENPSNEGNKDSEYKASKGGVDVCQTGL